MERVLEVCVVFGNGRIQLKKKVRVVLDVGDGDELYFMQGADGKLYIEKAPSSKRGSGRYTKISG